MRILVYLVELLVVVAVAWGVYRAVVRYLGERSRATELEGARWKRRVIGLEDGRVRVEVARRGVDNAVPVETLDPRDANFDVAVYEAEARADDLATSLNAGEDS